VVELLKNNRICWWKRLASGSSRPDFEMDNKTNNGRKMDGSIQDTRIRIDFGNSNGLKGGVSRTDLAFASLI
jgi:hypothetical protein